MAQFGKVCQPVLRFIRELKRSHVLLVIDKERAEILQGSATFMIEKQERTEHHSSCPVYGVTPIDDEPCQCNER